MNRGKRSNVSPIRRVKSYRELWEEAGRPKDGGLAMLAKAEQSGALAHQLGYTEEPPSSSAPNSAAR